MRLGVAITGFDAIGVPDSSRVARLGRAGGRAAAMRHSIITLHDDLCALIDGRAGTWGVYARHLGTGETVAIRADDVMPAQSSVKVCVLLTYTKAIRLGQDNRGRRVSLLDEDH